MTTPITPETLRLGRDLLGWTLETSGGRQRLATDLEILVDLLRRSELEDLLRG